MSILYSIYLYMNATICSTNLQLMNAFTETKTVVEDYIKDLKDITESYFSFFPIIPYSNFLKFLSLEHIIMCM